MYQIFRELREYEINGQKGTTYVYFIYVGKIKVYFSPKDSTSKEILKDLKDEDFK